MIPTMKNAEMVMPSGFSLMFSTSAYSSTRVSTVKPTAARRCLFRIAETVTANAPETIMARNPVAYAPAWASTSALKTMARTTQTNV